MRCDSKHCSAETGWAETSSWTQAVDSQAAMSSALSRCLVAALLGVGEDEEARAIALIATQAFRAPWLQLLAYCECTYECACEVRSECACEVTSECAYERVCEVASECACEVTSEYACECACEVTGECAYQVISESVCECVSVSVHVK